MVVLRFINSLSCLNATLCSMVRYDGDDDDDDDDNDGILLLYIISTLNIKLQLQRISKIKLYKITHVIANSAFNFNVLK